MAGLLSGQNSFQSSSAKRPFNPGENGASGVEVIYRLDPVRSMTRSWLIPYELDAGRTGRDDQPVSGGGRRPMAASR